MADNPDMPRLYLAQERLQLWALDVVEHAEVAVRHSWDVMLQDVLDCAMQQLWAAREQLALARTGTDLAAIATAEQAVCTAQQIVEVTLRRRRNERQTELAAEDTYRKARHRQQMRVLAAQRALARHDDASA